MLLAGRDGHVADMAVGIADGQRNFGIVGPEQQIAHRDVGGVVGMLGESFFVDRHHLGQRQPVDRDDVVAGADPGGARHPGPTVKRTVVASRGETAKPARLPSSSCELFSGDV